MDPFVSFEENKVLRIQPLLRNYTTLSAISPIFLVSKQSSFYEDNFYNFLWKQHTSILLHNVMFGEKDVA
jgi:hypothetical protein